ncbi:cytoplasmic FMR1 interacting protein [Musa troglodytarum]|uniref:Cytoplasmic FMR1 interacting protein n=1 Tax=Musa troglodytarum TaxID=320322 RepID=A0A9E7FU28_9LILI|nr:cytoplasmic FMR1 interacting protein [Musa troglodytarum]
MPEHSEDEQPDVQGLAILLSTERCATNSPLGFVMWLFSGIHNALIHEGREMASLLYTYRSCVKALPQLPDSMKHNQADLYLETYQVLDLEMSRLREIQRWQASAASKCLPFVINAHVTCLEITTSKRNVTVSMDQRERGRRGEE